MWMAGLVAHLMMESMLRAMLQAIESISIIIMNSLPLLTAVLYQGGESKANRDSVYRRS